MIFDENYDRSLWLLVASNKSDSDKICRLISYIPEDVYRQIQDSINNYYNGIIKNNTIFNTSLSNIEGYDYYITVKIVNDKLYFNVLRWIENKGRVEEEYQLVLQEMLKEYLTDMSWGDKRSLAKYSSEFNNIKFVGNLTAVDTESDDRRYRVTKVPFGFVVTTSKNKMIVAKKYVNLFKNMPEEIYLDDFSSEEKREGLVKKKKRYRK